MLMPKAAMNEDHFATAGEYDVWLAWKVLAMKAKAIA
jgi:hypothetical protein